MLQSLDGIGLEPVINPSPALTIGQEAGLFQHPEVKGQLRLGKVQRTGQFADATFAGGETEQDALPVWIRQGLEQRGRLLIL